MTLQVDNHFVPQLALRRFASSPNRVWTYRVLVSRPSVPEWKEKSIRGVAYYTHLYTRLVSGVETDDVEKWLNTEFETPAEEPLEKAISGMKLTPADWRYLARLVAAQDVRTPARLAENQARWDEVLPSVMEDTLKDTVKKLKEAKESGEPISLTNNTYHSEYIPMRITKEIEPGAEEGRLKVETLAGRGLWLFSMKHTLTHTLRVLLDHRWTILKPPDGVNWFTSDDPVVKLNYYGEGKYDFKGSWGNKGTEIFLPLDPHHLLYTKIGDNPPPRGTVVSRDLALTLRRFIAGHAYRTIFSSSPDLEVSKLRPRRVDDELLRYENEQWQKWHEVQSKAERELMGWPDPKP